MTKIFQNSKIHLIFLVLNERIKRKVTIAMMKPNENVVKQDKIHQAVPKVVRMAKNSDQDESRKSHYDIINILLHRFNVKSELSKITFRWKSLKKLVTIFATKTFRLQRNELKCDIELHPDCGKKGKVGQQARQKFRPDPREAMWTKINRALRLAALEVWKAINTHICQYKPIFRSETNVIYGTRLKRKLRNSK